jgi:hypothetical protein
VVIRGTGAPVTGVIAQLVSVGTTANRRREASLSLGSVAVARDGSFEIAYSKSPSARGGAQTRPNLRIDILGPSIGDGIAKSIAQSDVRSAAAECEYFLIEVDAERLPGKAIIGGLAAASRSPDAAIAARAINAEREKNITRRTEMRSARRAAVDEARALEKERSRQVRDRMLSHVTKVKPGSEAWSRLVAPGDDAQQVTTAYQKTALAGPVKKVTESGEVTYLVLSDAEFATLGSPPDSHKVEALLRRKSAGPQLVREDLLAKCRAQSPTMVPPEDEEDEEDDETESSSTADQKVEELVAAIVPPDQLTLDGPIGQEGVATKVLGLNLAKGPADVPAFYDFHRLELAFDHVWEDARADGYIERAKELYRIAENLGGDPASALDSGEPPMRVLAREARLAIRANKFELRSNGGNPGWMALDKGTRRPGNVSDWTDPDDWVLEDDNWDRPSVDPDPPPPPPPTDPQHPADVSVDPNLEIWPGDPVVDGSGNYPFTVFAADSVNFGLLVTYQQCFEPLNYQVGRLVGTRTLGPKETYSFTTRQVVKTSYNRKQVQANQQLKRDEAEDTYRDEAEIVNRAQAKTNFALSTSGSYDLGPLGEGTATTTMGRDAESSSQETKRAQRSSVRKAAQEAKSEMRMELESTVSSETETVEKREIVNPNDELALTCVFYELQRRYRVSEKLHRVTPVILVAQRVPRPEEINDDWIIRHDWIIRRFLPDDSFESALTYLSTRAAGDQVILAELLAHMTQLRNSVRDLTTQILSVRNRANKQLEAIQNYVNQQSQIVAAEDSEGWLESAWEKVAGEGEGSRDAIRILEEAARERYEKAVRDEQDLRARLEREATALQVATDEYTKALAEHSNRRVEIDRLIKHIRAFILHYMQGIWSYEHPDQRFFRHHTLTAPRLTPLTRNYTLVHEPNWPVGVMPEPDKKCYRVTFTTTVAFEPQLDANGNPVLDSDGKPVEARATLAELVDLDRMIGFKGNYIIYPLKDSNGLTDYMMTPYIDTTMGVRDPDGAGNWTLEEFRTYIECLKKTLKPSEFNKIEDQLEEQAKKILTSPHRDGEHITIPSNSLYMQMLVDSGKALEGFKEEHRKMDVLKVKAEVRAAELDNLRRAKLVLADKLEDPNIESVKNVYYRGAVAPHDGDE